MWNKVKTHAKNRKENRSRGRSFSAVEAIQDPRVRAEVYAAANRIR